MDVCRCWSHGAQIGEKVYSRKLTREYNRPLKNAIKQAVQASIHAHDNQFRRQYLRLTLEKGLAISQGQANRGQEYIGHIVRHVEKG